MTNREIYNSKIGTVDECLSLIESGDMVCIAGDSNQPETLCRSLHTIADRVENVLCIKPRYGDFRFVTDPGMDGHINTTGFFFGPQMQQGQVLGNVSYMPTDLWSFESTIGSTRPSDVFMAAASPMDEDGNMCVGLFLMWETTCYKTSKKVILEINPHLPKVRGGLMINVRDVDRLIEVDYPIATIPSIDPSPEELQVARNVRSLVRDGDCIQLGIGSLPDAIANEMMDLHELGLHTEMMTSNMGEMIRRGIITGEHKRTDPGEHVCAFAGGDDALYRTLSTDPKCRIAPATYVCDPTVIMQNDNVVSINTCIEMDLTGQICSESIGPKQYSGSGGAMDFALGAFHSKGGRGIIAFTSATRKGLSKINTLLTHGAAVTIPRNYADYIVTEYGVACLRGRTVRERAEQLIAIAHPSVRDHLRREAKELFYIF